MSDLHADAPTARSFVRLLSGTVSVLVSVAVRRPWKTIALSLLMLLSAFATAASTFRMTTNTTDLISSDVGWRRDERAIKDAFPQLRDLMLVVVDGATPELAEDATSRLAARMKADHRHFRLVRRPDGGDFFAREGLLFGSVTQVRDATDALVRAQPLLGPLAADPSLRGVANSLVNAMEGVDRGDTTLGRMAPQMRAMTGAIDRLNAGRPAAFSWQRLAGGDTAPAAPTRRLILTRPVMDYGSLTPGAPAEAAVAGDARVLELDARHGVTVRLTGDVPLSDEEFATLRDNIGVVALVMLAAMLATLWLATRSLRLVAAIVATIVTGLVVTAAIGLAAVGRFNLISIAFVPLFVGLGVDFGIQVCIRFNAERADGCSSPEALRRVAAALGPSLMLAAGAVFLGFGAFLPTAYVGIAELGVIAGIGMVVALGLSVTLLPALIIVSRPATPRGEVGLGWLAPVDRWLERRRSAVLWAFGVSLLLSVAALPSLRFDFNPLHLRDPNAPAMRTLSDLTRDRDRTPNSIDILTSDRATALALTARLKRLPGVSRVVSLDSFVPVDQQAKLPMIAQAATLLGPTIDPFEVAPPPTDPERVARLRAAASRLRDAARGGGAGADAALRLAAALDTLADAAPQRRLAAERMFVRPLRVMLAQTRASLQAASVDEATLPAEIVRDWRTPDGRYRLQVFPSGDIDSNRVMAAFRRAVSAIAPNASGLPVATQAAARTVATAFVQAGVIAFALVSLLLLAVLRNGREVLFTLAPVALSIFLTLGTCVAIGQPINFANIIAFPLLFGVGVAFHIYFVMAWRAGVTALLATSLARAVLFSALATGTAFGSLWLSDHPGTASMGKILMISIVWTLVCALVFEPALLGPPISRRSGGRRAV